MEKLTYDEKCELCRLLEYTSIEYIGENSTWIQLKDKVQVEYPEIVHTVQQLKIQTRVLEALTKQLSL